MAYSPYLTYEEYCDLGGNYDEDDFTVYERKAHRLIDYITFNRIPLLEEVPEEVKECMVEFIGKISSFDKQVEGGEALARYSNGVETLEYKLQTTDENREECRKIAFQFLPNYLVARSVSFDAKEYIQSANNNH